MTPHLRLYGQSTNDGRWPTFSLFPVFLSFTLAKRKSAHSTTNHKVFLPPPFSLPFYPFSSNSFLNLFYNYWIYWNTTKNKNKWKLWFRPRKAFDKTKIQSHKIPKKTQLMTPNCWRSFNNNNNHFMFEWLIPKLNRYLRFFLIFFCIWVFSLKILLVSCRSCHQTHLISC